MSFAPPRSTNPVPHGGYTDLPSGEYSSSGEASNEAAAMGPSRPLTAEEVRAAHAKQQEADKERFELLAELKDEFHIGMRVRVFHYQTYEGVVRFVGNTVLGLGPWIGVEMDDPVGRYSGSVEGIQYFDCPEGHGIFVPPDGLEPVQTFTAGMGTVPHAVNERYYLKKHRELKKARKGRGRRHRAAPSSPLLKLIQNDPAHQRISAPQPGRSILPPAPNFVTSPPSNAAARLPDATYAMDTWTGRYGDDGSEAAGGLVDRFAQIREEAKPYFEVFAPETLRRKPELHQRVRVKGRFGTIKYISDKVLFSFGKWVGIELDHKIQDPSELAEKGVVVCDHNGEHRGTFYFKCRPRCGIFCHPDKVEWIPPEYSEAPPKDLPRSRGYNYTSVPSRKEIKRISKKRRKRKKAKRRTRESMLNTSAEAGASSSAAPGMSVSFAPTAGAAGASPAAANVTSGYGPFGGSGSLGAHGVMEDHSAAAMIDPAAATSSVVVPPGASDMHFRELENKVWGMYLGALVGSAASFYAGSPPPWPFCHDCDLMITILNALAANHGEADEYVFAQHLKRFCDQGLYDESNAHSPSLLRAVVSTPGFEGAPHDVAMRAFTAMPESKDSNAAVARTPILGLYAFWDLPRVVEATKDICQVTHTDPRCVASCVAVTVAIAKLFQSAAAATTAQGLEEVIATACEWARKEAPPDEVNLVDAIQFATLGDLDLGNRANYTDTYKALGAGFYALRTGTDFETTINEIKNAGGDVQINCAVAGALLGAKLGHYRFPRDMPVHVKDDVHFEAHIPQDWIDNLGADVEDEVNMHLHDYLELIHLTEDKYAMNDEY